MNQLKPMSQSSTQFPPTPITRGGESHTTRRTRRSIVHPLLALLLSLLCILTGCQAGTPGESPSTDVAFGQASSAIAKSDHTHETKVEPFILPEVASNFVGRWAADCNGSDSPQVPPIQYYFEFNSDGTAALYSTAMGYEVLIRYIAWTVSLDGKLQPSRIDLVELVGYAGIKREDQLFELTCVDENTIEACDSNWGGARLIFRRTPSALKRK